MRVQKVLYSGRARITQISQKLKSIGAKTNTTALRIISGNADEAREDKVHYFSIVADLAGH